MLVVEKNFCFVVELVFLGISVAEVFLDIFVDLGADGIVFVVGEIHVEELSIEKVDFLDWLVCTEIDSEVEGFDNEG